MIRAALTQPSRPLAGGGPTTPAATGALIRILLAEDNPDNLPVHTGS